MRLAAVLHEHTELDPEHMNFVTALIMDKTPSIRTRRGESDEDTDAHAYRDVPQGARDFL